MVRALVESAMMIAFATVLSLLKIIELPYGGSVTMASMLPVIILSFRHGIGWGLGSGVAYAALQQLLGLNNLSYVTGWQSILAIIMLDYIVAFTVVGLGGAFRRVFKTQRGALVTGALFTSVLRYVCHVISGATVWAGLSIPDEAALIYSLSYNLTYMLPEAIILTTVAYYLGGVIDFTKETPIRVASQRTQESTASLGILSGLSFLLGIIVDVTLIAPHLQSEESGEFSFTGLADVSWIAVAIVSAVAFITGVSLLVYIRMKRKKS